MVKHESGKCQCGHEKHEFEQLVGILAKFAGKKGTLIPILQETQDVYGYLPEQALHYIADKTQTPISQIYGVVTFYSQFHLKPRGRNIIRVCQGTACHVRGANAIMKAVEEYLGVGVGKTTPDLRFTFETVACIGACGLAPVMMINDDTHGRLTPDMIPTVLGAYR